MGLGQRGHLGHRVTAEHARAPGDRGAHRLGRLLGRGGPALAVATDPGGVQRAEAVEGVGRPRAEQGVVAAQQPAVHVAGVVEHRLQGRAGCRARRRAGPARGASVRSRQRRTRKVFVSVFERLPAASVTAAVKRYEPAREPERAPEPARRLRVELQRAAAARPAAAAPARAAGHADPHAPRGACAGRSHHAAVIAGGEAHGADAPATAQAGHLGARRGTVGLDGRLRAGVGGRSRAGRRKRQGRRRRLAGQQRVQAGVGHLGVGGGDARPVHNRRPARS